MSRTLLVGLVACGACGSTAPATGSGGQPAVVEMAPVSAPATDRDTRCHALFDLFEHKLSPGMAAPAAAAVLRDSMTLINVDQPITAIGGEVPLEIDFDDSLAVVHCLATPNPDLQGALWSPWVIYHRFSGHAAPTLHAFVAADASVTLREYTLFWPDAHMTRHR